ncbi:uroporphyrinogen-III synthase [Sphingobium cloacae]|uniref:Tetrapyrrole biosynthesis uroporphyrinogen III synthase domain-containing protein n=1 Tax=Sphingobium cloacae TaxID=120107 RepID=A0A1E1EYH7_9SPHN|nr:uroporphyrinogen-III synthase [Sphingobium cloacae]BAV63262.1 hypothetical protein SCLO_1002220 [Sphingobium cloacae]
MTFAVWVTRTDPFNRLTARHLRAAGYEALTEPVLRVVPAARPVAYAVPDALVFTSLNGIRLHRFLPGLAGLPIFTVGDRSARFACTRGYRHVFSAGGVVEDLRRTVRETMWPGADILHVGAADSAGALTEALCEDGFRARQLHSYHIVEAEPRDLEWIAGQLGEIGSILVHSPRAGRHIAGWLMQQAADWGGEIVCISPAAAESFVSFARAKIKVAPRPDEISLLAPLLRAARRSK